VPKVDFDLPRFIASKRPSRNQLCLDSNDCNLDVKMASWISPTGQHPSLGVTPPYRSYELVMSSATGIQQREESFRPKSKSEADVQSSRWHFSDLADQVQYQAFRG